MDISVVIVAAGRGQRMGGDIAKQYLTISGQTILEHTLSFWDRCPGVSEIILVLPPEDLGLWAGKLRQEYKRLNAVVPGGKDRTESVLSGVGKAMAQAEFVAVHDGVRPLLSEEMVLRVFEGAKQCDCVIPVVPLRDTVKKIDPEGYVTATPPRECMVAVQTPQLFRRRVLLELLRAPRRHPVTDEATLFERAGHPVLTVPGDLRNIKITTVEDLLVAEVFLKEQRK